MQPRMTTLPRAHSGLSIVAALLAITLAGPTSAATPTLGWSLVDDGPAFSDAAFVDAAAMGDAGFVIGGSRFGIDTEKLVELHAWSTTDGLIWEDATLPVPEGDDLTVLAVAASPEVAVATGWSGDSGPLVAVDRPARLGTGRQLDAVAGASGERCRRHRRRLPRGGLRLRGRRGQGGRLSIETGRNAPAFASWLLA